MPSNHPHQLPDEPDPLEPRPSGRDEMNLADFPFALLQRASEDGVYTYEGWISDRSGERHRQKWVVRSATGLGLPTEFDERVVVALMAVSAQQGFASRRVVFSVYQLLAIMGLARSPRIYEAVQRSLERLVGVTIYAEGAFWDNGERTWVKLKSGFHLIEKFWLAYLEEDERVREAEGVSGYFVWSEDLWKSILDGYIKELDLDFYYRLELPIARRLYRFLDKRMAYQGEYEIDIYELTNRLGMTRYDYPSHALRKLQPALDELQANGFLLSAEAVKVGKYTRLRFRRHLPPSARSAPAGQAPASDDAPEVQEALVELGFAHGIAGQLLDRYGPEHVREKLAYLRWELEVRGKTLRSPRGWLRKAIEEDYGAPAGYDPTYWSHELAGEAEEVWEEATALPPRPTPEQELWGVVLHDLEGQVPPGTFQVFLSYTRLLKVDQGVAVIGVPSPQVQEWLEHRLGRLIARALAYRLGHEVQLVFVLLQA